MGDPSVKAYSMENDSLDPGSGSYADESWMDTPLNNGIREITVSTSITYNFIVLLVICLICIITRYHSFIII